MGYSSPVGGPGKGRTKRIFLPVLLLLVWMHLGAATGWAQGSEFLEESYGIHLGGERRFNGLRLNISDQKFKQVNGVNFSLLPDSEEGGEINGLSLGFGVGGRKSSLNGLALGATTDFERIRGISIGGWNGALREWAPWRERDGEDQVLRADPTLIGLKMDFLKGTTSRGVGISVSGLLNYSGEFDGLTFAGLFNYADSMTGIQIGIVNYAKVLNGIQIGIINYAGNNPAGLRWLPILNLHISFD